MRRLIGLSCLLGMYKDDAKSAALESGIKLIRMAPSGLLKTENWTPGRLTIIYNEANIVVNASFS